MPLSTCSAYEFKVHAKTIEQALCLKNPLLVVFQMLSFNSPIEAGTEAFALLLISEKYLQIYCRSLIDPKLSSLPHCPKESHATLNCQLATWRLIFEASGWNGKQGSWVSPISSPKQGPSVHYSLNSSGAHLQFYLLQKEGCMNQLWVSRGEDERSQSRLTHSPFQPLVLRKQRWTLKVVSWQPCI